MSEEPSYMAFARANVRDGLTTSHTVVRELVARIDRQDRKESAAAEAVEKIGKVLDSFYVGETYAADALMLISRVRGEFEAKS